MLDYEMWDQKRHLQHVLSGWTMILKGTLHWDWFSFKQLLQSLLLQLCLPLKNKCIVIPVWADMVLISFIFLMISKAKRHSFTNPIFTFSFFSSIDIILTNLPAIFSFTDLWSKVNPREINYQCQSWGLVLTATPKMSLNSYTVSWMDKVLTSWYQRLK